MSSEKPQRRPRIQFSLRAMLILTLLVAAYAAGWISHREWNQRNLIRSITQAIEAANAPVKVEIVEGTDIFMTRGRKEDVDAVMRVIEEAKK